MGVIEDVALGRIAEIGDGNVRGRALQLAADDVWRTRDFAA